MTESVTTECFNLVEALWLPATLAANFPDAERRRPDPRVSLREAFEYGDRIVELRCYPHERIALMRLLICIAQRALNGPEDENDWKTCEERLATAAVRYLEQHKDRFNLFGEGPRFLQAHGSGKPGEMSVFRLKLVDKDSSTLFDRHVEPGARLDSAQLAVALATFQAFAAGGKTGGSEPSPAGRETKDKKIKYEPQSGEAALCRDGSALHSFLLGRNLKETIHRNLICRSQIASPMTWSETAAPVWEYGQTKLGELPETEIVASYLGRLAPLARAVWLNENRQSAEIASGLRYGVFADSTDANTEKIKPGTYIREPTASIQPGKTMSDKPRLVSASAGGGLPKAAWRELHSIAVLRHSEKRGGPSALEHLRTFGSEEAALWCGALVGYQAKVGDVIESSFRLPIQFMEDAGDSESLEDAPRKLLGPNHIYRQGAELAEGWSNSLQKAVQKYYALLNGEDLGSKAKDQAASRYWTVLEHVAERVLLYDVALHSEKYFPSAHHWIEESPWGDEVKRAAADAYNFACAHTTPRQLRAYVAGLAQLRPGKNQKTRTAKYAEAVGESAEGDES